MITRKEFLTFLDCTVSVLTDIRQIVAVVPSYASFLHHLEMFRDFLKKEYENQN